MKEITLFCILLILASCHSTRHSQGNHTSNSSRSSSKTSERSSSKQKASTKKNTNDGAYLDEVSSSDLKSESKGDSKSNSTLDSASDRKSTTAKGDNRFERNLIVEAERQIGVKYRYGGTSPSRGFDCSGFTSYVFDKLDIELPRTSTDQSKAGKRKKFGDAEVGDLVFFGTGIRVTHVGIVVSKSKNKMEVIHSTSSSGVKRDEIFGSTYWSARTLWAVDVTN